MTLSAALPDRAVIRLSGEDRKAFLQGLVTQDVETLAPGGAMFTALLTPQGKILFDFFVIDTGDAYLLDCWRKAASDLVKRLSLYKLRAKVKLEIDDALSVAVSEKDCSDHAIIAYRDPRLDDLGWRAILENAAGEAGAYDNRRIALGVPEFGKDFGANEVFPLDVNYDALNAVSYQKGCFIGQEVASRMKRKSDIRKRTLVVEYDDPALAKGSAIMAGDSKLGETMSSSPGKALAMIRLDRWEKAKAAGVEPAIEGGKLRLHIPDYLEQA